jgi:tetratricopeptide (TPR) repeat protein
METITKPLSTIITIGTLTLTLLSACSKDSLYRPDPNMPQELKEQHETVLKEKLAILEENPDDGDARFQAAFHYQMLGDFSRAIKYYKWTLEYDPNHAVSLNNLADIHETVVEDYETAAEYIKKLYALKPDDREAVSDAVRILLKAENFTNAYEALENYKKLVINTENPDPVQEEFIKSLKVQINDFMNAKNKIKK